MEPMNFVYFSRLSCSFWYTQYVGFIENTDLNRVFTMWFFPSLCGSWSSFFFLMRSPMLFNDSNEYWFKSTLWCLAKIREPMHFYHTHTYAAAAAKRHRHFFSSFFLIVRLNFSSYFSFVFFHSLFERYSDPFVRSSKCYYANDETQRIQIGQWLIEYDMKNICM